MNSDWNALIRHVKLSPSGRKRICSSFSAFCLRWGFTGARRWMMCSDWIRTFLPTASFTTSLMCSCLTASRRGFLTVLQNRSGMCGPGTTSPPALSPREITTTGLPPCRWMRRSACVMMRSPPGSITAMHWLIVKQGMTPARSRKPNLVRFTPGFTTSGNSTGQPAFTCSATPHISPRGRCWSRRGMSLRT
ncbi:hypothetical protein BvCmsNSNP012_04600 [Escherichia coli]|nr:hypothetical protein BvCmsNSNP012_04600 [Escherichia coli]